MNFPLHLFRLQPAGADRQSVTIQVVTRADAHPGKPLFRAPALPTPNQFNSELPFTAKFPATSPRSALMA
jgi:hypothetical protein